jgi:hypothetical protein
VSAATLRALWARRPRLACGCSPPCRCELHARPSRQRVDGYAAAVRWLGAHGVGAAPLGPELAALARRGGADAELAEAVRGRWAA